jgi:hypothetical protein
MAIEPNSAPIFPDSKWFNSSPWNDGINPIFYPAVRIFLVDSNS